MTRALKIVPANDTFAALIAFADVLDGKSALFISGPEVNGIKPEIAELPDTVADDTALILETSGSTGMPKRISISREALIASAKASSFALDADETSSQWLLALPINYIAGANVLIRSVMAGSQPVIMNTSLPFTAEAFARMASQMKAEKRFTSLVPTQLGRLAHAIDQDEFLLEQMRRFDAILVGGQAVDYQLLGRLEALGINVVTTYGLTETSGGCVYNGIPIGDTQFKLFDDRVSIKGSVLANVETDADGFFATQDAGLVDESGRLAILGRIDRVINSGGIKVSLDRVEQLAARVTGVVDVAATAISDFEWGQRVGIAYLGSPEVADDIAKALANDLGPAGKPIRLLRVDKIPKTSSSKNNLEAVAKLFEEIN
jgi:O-succinylbenzoic acid--CoA ligase